MTGQKSESTDVEPFGGYTQTEGLKARFDQFIQEHAGMAGIDFLKIGVDYAEKQLGIPPADLLLQFCDAIIGNHYPVPDRMLKHCETICAAYIRKEFGAGRPFDRPFDTFVTEGWTVLSCCSAAALWILLTPRMPKRPAISAI